MIENSTIIIDNSYPFIDGLFGIFVFFLPLIICLIIIGFLLWVIGRFHEESWGNRP